MTASSAFTVGASSADVTASSTFTVGASSADATASSAFTVGASSLSDFVCSKALSILFVISSVKPKLVSFLASLVFSIKSNEDVGSLFSYNFSVVASTLVSTLFSSEFTEGVWDTSFCGGAGLGWAFMKGITYFSRAAWISDFKVFILVSQSRIGFP